MVSTVRVVSWNVLAAPWASPAFYGPDLDSTILDRDARAELVGCALRELAPDLACLQETTPPDLARTLAVLGDGYDHRAAANGRDLWASWSTPELPWEPNGTAVLWRRDRFREADTAALELSTDGNVATVVDLTGPGGVPWLVRSVHLDADDAALRREQLPVALGPPGSAAVTIVAGDCNEDTAGADLAAIVESTGFVDALTVLGATEPTHPYARPGDDWVALARLDHVLVRGAEPLRAGVEDSGTWSVDEPGPRLEEHLRRTGSDHLPVWVEVAAS